jgi:hypothetical protein
MTTLIKGDRVNPSGWGRTSTWRKIKGTVTDTQVPLHKGQKTKVFVWWDGTSFEDEMEPQELAKVTT